MHRAKGVFMLNRRAVIIVVAALTVSFSGGAFRLPAQEPVSLTGHIKSDDEGLMEGVAVNARRAGSNMTVTVISNAKGVYSFPQNRIEAGQYSITVRAVGYDLASPVTVAVSPQSPATQAARYILAAHQCRMADERAWNRTAEERGKRLR